MLSEWKGRSNAIAGLESEQVYINYIILNRWFTLQAYVCDWGVGHTVFFDMHESTWNESLDKYKIMLNRGLRLCELLVPIFVRYISNTLYIQMHINVIVLYAQTIILLYFSLYTWDLLFNYPQPYFVKCNPDSWQNIFIARIPKAILMLSRWCIIGTISTCPLYTLEYISSHWCF